MPDVIEIGSIWIPGPRLTCLSKPRKVIGAHPFDPDLVYTRTTTVDGAGTATGKAQMIDATFLLEQYLPLAKQSG
jgi:hypothetical protein